MSDLLADIADTVLTLTAAERIVAITAVQTLWSGYGEIERYLLRGGEVDSVIVKRVNPPTSAHHPRGWHSDLSHQRKLRSYAVESHWYQEWSSRLSRQWSPLPHCYAVKSGNDGLFMVLEDLDQSGFPLRKERVSPTGIEACLSWLAHFHATFMGVTPEGLWPSGSYWHLQTRPDELAALDDPELRQAAAAIDLRLRSARFQSIIHGDAKLANFCFASNGNKVAAVDFQYVGGGCGMKDVAYFVGSCLSEQACEAQEKWLLDCYFHHLSAALKRLDSPFSGSEVEEEWRPLYAVAWTDFHRFIKGWSPGHWKIHSYSERLARTVVATLSAES
ncbi:MAG: phosphotransferase [Gammaproteobacteria bacterium]|nr:phosphotransferase [Gammaproteobacteria bacterium]